MSCSSNENSCIVVYSCVLVGRLLRPDIVYFYFTCLGTEIFLQELTLPSTLSSNPLRRPAVFSPIAILSLLILRKIFSLFNVTDE